MRKTRKNYTADEKVAILRRHLIDRISVADLCDELQIQTTLFYKWQTQFFENGAAALQRENTDPQATLRKTIDSFQEKLQRKNEDIVPVLVES